MANIDGTGLDDTLVGTAGDDNINGFGGNDLINAGGGDDYIDGGDGNDKLYGGAGYDQFRPGAGNDDIDGGVDGGFISYQDHTGSVIADLSPGLIYDDGTGGFDNAINVNGIHGGSAGDTISVAIHQHVFGRGGDDYLSGSGNLNGGSGDDTLVGDSNTSLSYFADPWDHWGLPFQGANVNLATGIAIDNYGFTDSIIGSFAHLIGSSMDDTLHGGASTGVNGDGGDDVLSGGGWINGGSGNDTLNGSGQDLDYWVSDGDSAGTTTAGAYVDLAAGSAIDS